VPIADAQEVRGLAPRACETDIHVRVLAGLSWHDLVPTIWPPDLTIRRERELARFRLFVSELVSNVCRRRSAGPDERLSRLVLRCSLGRPTRRARLVARADAPPSDA
jgi:hypothetical protein